MATPKQIAANQRNAQKSTGPKTPAGKATASLNAIKHGLLSDSVVVAGHFYTENPLEFQLLCCELEQDLRPVGRVEELLVERIAICFWRSRRAVRAENGEIRLSADTGIHAHLKRRQHAGEAMARRCAATELWTSSATNYLVNVLERLHKRVQADGRLTLEALQDVSVAFENRETGLLAELRQFRTNNTTNSNGLDESNDNSKNCRDVLAYLDEKIASFRHLCEDIAADESQEDLARLDAAVLPSAATLDKILRYETTLERQLYRAMDQLERLQRRRQGEDVPPPVNMEVSHRL